MNRNTDFIPFARPDLGPEEEEAVLKVMRSGWLTTGEEAAAFEREFAERLGVSHALAVNSGTAALHLIFAALDLQPGDKVITTPYTFTATAEVLRYSGADPLFADIDPRTGNIDPCAVEETLRASLRRGESVKAILPVHLAGLPADMPRLEALSREYSIPLVEDAAHAFPVRCAGGWAGARGQAGMFSFYANKTITTGEGGMLVTDDDEIARKARILRLHGIDRDVWNRYRAGSRGWQYAVVEAGYKYNMTDLAAAIGRVQLRRAGKMKASRTAAARYYAELFSGNEFFTLPPGLPEDERDHAWHLFTITLRPQTLSLSRDELIEALQKRGIGTSVHFIPLHIMPYYRDRYGLKAEDFPRAMERFETTLSLPLFPGITQEEQERVAEELRDLCESCRRRHDAG